MARGDRRRRSRALRDAILRSDANAAAGFIVAGVGWDPNLWQGSSIGVQGSGRALAASAAAPQARQCRRHDPTIAQVRNLIEN